MAEPRRVELKTISVTNGEKKAKKQPLTQRFTLALGESTVSTCPEFSFTELLKKEKKATGSVPSLNPDDPFGDEDDHDEVAAIARKLEEKYGPKPKKKLKCLEDEYYDLGEGYDENDPFIDNTEAYDEVVPSCLTTQHGGFYINRGTLDFRTLSDQEDSAAEFIPTVKKRGRPRKILDSESEHEDGGEPKKKKIKKKKLKEGIDGEKKKKKKISVGPDGEKIIKKRKAMDPDKKKKTSPTVAELLKQQTASTSATPNGTIDDLQPGTPSVGSDLHPVDKSTIQDRIDAVICEQLQDGPSQDRKINGSETGAPNNLPSDIPVELVRTIDNIKQAAKDTTEGKCKFFSGNVNKMLLDIELGSRQLAFGKRSSIYAHLADHLPCGKETLIKRAKKLRENQQDDQLKGPIQRLKDAINVVMPALQEQHELEVQRYKMENKEKMEDGGDGPKEEGANTESDDEEKTSAAGASDGQSRKGNRGPRKKFKWTPDIKKQLCDIVRIKMQMFDTYRHRNQTAEEYLKTFLDNEVKPLWPQGWIQTRMLFKESRSVHGSWTNPTKPKKPVLVTKTTASPQPQVSVSVSPENPPENKPAKVTIVPDVIELSNDDDDDIPLAPAMRKEMKVNTASTILDIADEPRAPPAPVDMLNISPNSVARMAAAAAAAVSTPTTQPPADRLTDRQNLVTEILKGMKPNSVGLTMPSRPSTVHNTPTTPPTPHTPHGKDAVFQPFLAEFDRFLSSRHGGQGSSGPSQLSTPGQQTAQQLQSKTVSSSTSKFDNSGDAKSKQSPQIKWQMDALLSDDKHVPQRKSSPSSLSAGLVSVPGAAASDSLSAQQAHYKKMYSLLSEPTTAAQRSKGEVVRDEILSRIQAEMDASASLSLKAEDHSRKAASASQSSPKQHTSASSPSGRQSHQVFPGAPAAAHSGKNQRHSMGGAIPPAHQASTQLYPKAAGGSPRQTSTSGSQLSLGLPGSDRSSVVSKSPGTSAFSPKQHSSLQSSPSAARSGLGTGRPSGRNSPHNKLTPRLSPTSGSASAAMQRNIPGQVSSKAPQAHSSKGSGQGSQSHHVSAFVRHSPQGQSQRSPTSHNQAPHGQKGLQGQGHTSSHSLDGTHKMSMSASQLPGGGSNSTGASGSSGAQHRGIEQAYYERIESQIKQHAATEQKALQNLALSGLLPTNRSLLNAWSVPGQSRVSPTSKSQPAGSQDLSGGKLLGSSPLSSQTSPVPRQSQTAQGHTSGLYNQRPGAPQAYPSLHSHSGPLYKDRSKSPHGY